MRRMKMGNIEKKRVINRDKLRGEFSFNSILQEGYTHGLLNDTEIEYIQLQCLKLLAYKSERYNSGDSSSIRVETAESIMKSNLYTVGLFLKSSPNPDYAVHEIKTVMIPELYRKGRLLIDEKVGMAKRIYQKVKSNKISTSNYTYNATLSETGIQEFFRQYKPDYEAQEIPASIDYQLCNPVTDLTGIEFIQVYLDHLFLENEFCRHFKVEDIHYLLSGYDEGYEDLLINIFELVLTGALGCVLANRNVTKLNISEDDIKHLYHEFSKNPDSIIALKIQNAVEIMFEELNIPSGPLQQYIKISLPKIVLNITQAVKTKTLSRVLVAPIYPDLKPTIQLLTVAKMDDEDYRKLIEELLICRHSSDKLELIKEKVKSFGDIEDVLFDAMLTEEDVASVLDILGNGEIATLIKRHPYYSKIHAVDLFEAEQEFRSCLKNYMDKLSKERREQILGMVKYLI